ncbi:MAG: hypothetical protein AB8E82_04795 [Aureispira sp.]
MAQATNQDIDAQLLALEEQKAKIEALIGKKIMFRRRFKAVLNRINAQIAELKKAPQTGVSDSTPPEEDNSDQVAALEEAPQTDAPDSTPPEEDNSDQVAALEETPQTDASDSTPPEEDNSEQIAALEAQKEELKQKISQAENEEEVEKLDAEISAIDSQIKELTGEGGGAEPQTGALGLDITNAPKPEVDPLIAASLALVDQHFKIYGGIWDKSLWKADLGRFDLPIVPGVNASVIGSANVKAKAKFIRTGGSSGDVVGVGVSGSVDATGSVEVRGSIGIPVLANAFLGVKGSLIASTALKMSIEVDGANDRMNYVLPNLSITVKSALDLTLGIESPIFEISDADEKFMKEILAKIPGSSYSNGTLAYRLGTLSLLAITSGSIEIHSLTSVTLSGPSIKIHSSIQSYMKGEIDRLKANITACFNLAKQLWEGLQNAWDKVDDYILPWKWGRR